MSNYLIYPDYKITIQDRQYLQLVQGNDSKRIAAEEYAISIVRGKLTQKYDVNKEFTPTLPWNNNTVYNVRDRVYLDAAAYDSTRTYSVYDLCLNTGIVYICTSPTLGAFDPSKWLQLGAQYTVFYASYPSTCTYQGQTNPATLANPFAPEFSLVDISKGAEQRFYDQGDVVFWKGYTYTCVTGTYCITDEQLIQFISYKDVPYVNIFPDDPVNNAQNQFWGTKTAYTVPAGTLPTNTAYWTQGDNRTQEVMECVKDVAIYKLATLLSYNRNDWSDRYKGTLEYLRMCANGGVTLLMPIVLPVQGTRARYGGRVKQNNTY